MQKRKSYYTELFADYSSARLIAKEARDSLIALALKINAMKEPVLPEVGPALTLKQIEDENREWWPTHCEGPSSFRVERDSQNCWSSSSPVGMWAGCL